MPTLSRLDSDPLCNGEHSQHSASRFAEALAAAQTLRFAQFFLGNPLPAIRLEFPCPLELRHLHQSDSFYRFWRR